MTKFTKENLQVSGEYVHWIGDEIVGTRQRKFVGRFKHHNAAKTRNSFIKFLKANFTVEEYFAELDGSNRGPATILEAKGWVSPNMQAALDQAKIKAEQQGVGWDGTVGILFERILAERKV